MDVVARSANLAPEPDQSHRWTPKKGERRDRRGAPRDREQNDIRLGVVNAGKDLQGL